MKENILVVLRTLHHDESAQDLIEYALVGLLISCAAVATMSGLATVSPRRMCRSRQDSGASQVWYLRFSIQSRFGFRTA